MVNDEAEFRRIVLRELRPHFKIRTEIRGTNWQGRRLRLDAVLRPRDLTGWHDPAPVIGVEFKRGGGGGVGDLTRVIAQCVDYSMTMWDGYGRLSIFACGASSFIDDASAEFQGFILRLLGRFGIGFLSLDGRYGWTLSRDDQRYWSQCPPHYWNGNCPNNAGSLIPKVGSR
jgi:hypothetical protein